MFKNFGRVLIVAAHPDDEVLGVGGTIKIMTNLDIEVYTVIVTEGSSTQYEGNNDILQNKHTNSIEANELLGVKDVIIWNYPDMLLDTVPHSKLNSKIKGLIEEYNFDTVFVHSPKDINLDHRLIYESVMVACRPYPNQIVRNLLAYYVNSSTEWGNIKNENCFRPNYYVDINNTIDSKLKAMQCYEVELRPYPHPRSIEAIKNTAKYFGNIVGTKFIEPFQIIYTFDG